jgi:hypothetical protein
MLRCPVIIVVVVPLSLLLSRCRCCCPVVVVVVIVVVVVLVIIIVTVGGGGGGCCDDDDGIVTGLRAGQLSYCGLVSDSGKGFFSSSNCSDKPLGLPSLLFSWYRGLFPGGDMARV